MQMQRGLTTNPTPDLMPAVETEATSSFPADCRLGRRENLIEHDSAMRVANYLACSRRMRKLIRQESSGRASLASEARILRQLAIHLPLEQLSSRMEAYRLKVLQWRGQMPCSETTGTTPKLP